MSIVDQNVCGLYLVAYYVYLYIECEKLEPNIFFVFILGGKKYENHISKIIFFFFWN